MINWPTVDIGSIIKTSSCADLNSFSPAKRTAIEQHIIDHAGMHWHMVSTEMRSLFGETLYDRRNFYMNVIDDHYSIGKISKTRKWNDDITISTLDKYGFSITGMYSDLYDRTTTLSLTSSINKHAISAYLGIISASSYSSNIYTDQFKVSIEESGLRDRIISAKLLLYHRDTFVINYYSDAIGTYGNRLNDHVVSSPISIIRTPREIRAIAYSGLGLADFDINTCFPSLIQNILRAGNGICRFDGINHYITCKTAVREELAEYLQIPIRDAKSIINAMFFGASTRKRRLKKGKRNLRHILGGDEEKIARLRMHPLLIQLKEEIKRATIELIDLQTTENDQVTCMLERTTARYYSTKQGKRQHVQHSRLLSFIISSYETAVMQLIVARYGSSIKALVYDGFIGDASIEADELSKYILETTGFALTFSKTLLETQPLHLVPNNPPDLVDTRCADIDLNNTPIDPMLLQFFSDRFEDAQRMVGSPNYQVSFYTPRDIANLAIPEAELKQIHTIALLLYTASDGQSITHSSSTLNDRHFVRGLCTAHNLNADYADYVIAVAKYIFKCNLYHSYHS